MGALLMVVSAAVMTAPPRAVWADAGTELAKVERMVRDNHQDVTPLPSERFASMLANGVAPLILDVREEAEYSVSRIPGAVRVDPGISTKPFLSEFGDRAAGRDVVLYCSVGVRSARLASRVQVGLKAKGSKGVYNLEGGIFRWHNESKVLVDALGPADRVHPYNDYWGRLVERRDLISMQPRG